jgi:hypothetical protein
LFQVLVIVPVGVPFGVSNLVMSLETLAMSVGPDAVPSDWWGTVVVDAIGERSERATGGSLAV